MKKEKIQKKEFEESYFLFGRNYQFLQFLLYTDVILTDFSERIAGPTLGTSGKTFFVNFEPELQRSFMWPIQSAV